VLRDKNADADGLCDDERIYYLGDANFNITTLVNTAGDAVERYVYTPYGVLTVYDATWANIRSTSSYANAYTYAGRQLDAETGLYYYRSRVYAAQLGRFVSRDPVHYQGGLNLHEYCWSNSLVRTDPFGKWWWDGDWVQMGVGGLLGFYGSDVADEGWSKFGAVGGCETVREIAGWPQTQCICELAAALDILTDILFVAYPNPATATIMEIVAMIDCACSALTTWDLFCQGKCSEGWKDIILTANDCLADFVPEISVIWDVLISFFQEHNRGEDFRNRIGRIEKCSVFFGRQGPAI
jgi:RHS repeat-associated protein